MEKLMEILKAEYNYYKKAKFISEEKIQIAKTRNMIELEKNIDKEKEVIKKILSVEKERMELIRKDDCETLKDYLLLVDDEESKQSFKELREKLLLIIDEIQNNNEIAQRILKSSNEIINKFIETLSGKTDFGYTQTKKKSTISENSLLNTMG